MTGIVVAVFLLTTAQAKPRPQILDALEEIPGE
jgi:hypothetical protein